MRWLSLLLCVGLFGGSVFGASDSDIEEYETDFTIEPMFVEANKQVEFFREEQNQHIQAVQSALNIFKNLLKDFDERALQLSRMYDQSRAVVELLRNAEDLVELMPILNHVLSLMRAQRGDLGSTVPNKPAVVSDVAVSAPVESRVETLDATPVNKLQVSKFFQRKIDQEIKACENGISALRKISQEDSDMVSINFASLEMNANALQTNAKNLFQFWKTWVRIKYHEQMTKALLEVKDSVEHCDCTFVLEEKYEET